VDARLGAERAHPDRRRRLGAVPEAHPRGIEGRGLRPIALPDALSSSTPRWSPDGRWIVYGESSSEAPGSWQSVIRPDGTGHRRLDLWLQSTWSPDGRRIVLVRQCCGTHDYSTVTTIPARGGRERVRFRRSYYLGAVDWQPR
jgi:WD40-like Beta Propeller Repeat